MPARHVSAVCYDPLAASNADGIGAAMLAMMSATRSADLRIALICASPRNLGGRWQQVAAPISLLDGGATVPFVARYRKEATGAAR